MTDNPIVIGTEREGISSDQSLPAKEVGCEDVQNPALHGTVGDKQALPKSCDHIPGA